MATSSSSWCMLALALILGATLFGTCMANKEMNTKQWGWGRGWGRGSDRGRGWGWSRGSRRGGETGDRGSGWGKGGGRGWGHGVSVPPPSTPSVSNHSGSGCPLSQTNITRGSNNNIIVGGSNNWSFGYNYTDWALNHGPFYINDVLVFKYDAPENITQPGHSVYLLPDLWSYLKCDLSRAHRVASTTQGGDNGFEFKLTKWQPYYFACGEHNGIHCNLGMMKFSVMPIFRY